MDGANVHCGVVPDFFSASPFSDPYPLSREEIVSVQTSVPWSDNLDYVLSGMVRKYVYDFHRVSRSLRRYVEVILCDIDDETIDPNLFSEEACRLRWSLLDFEEYQRRQLVARELFTTRTLLASRSQASLPSHASDLKVFDTGIEAQYDSPRSETKTAKKAKQNLNIEQGSSFADEITFVDDKKSDAPSPRSSNSAAQTFKPATAIDLSCPREQAATKMPSHMETMDTSKNTAVSTKYQNISIVSEESDREARPLDDQMDHSTSNQKSPYVPAPTHTTPNPNPRQLSELEQSVLDEGLEISDFTIFSHDLKTQFEGFYNEVRGALPAMRDSSSSSDDDDEDPEEPVFSNLRVDEKTGEYVGHIVGLAPLNAAADSTPSNVGTASKTSTSASWTQSIVSRSAAGCDEKQGALREPKSQADISTPKYEGQGEVVLLHSVHHEEVLLEFDSEFVAESAKDSDLFMDWRREHAQGQACAGRGDHAGAVSHLGRAISAVEATSGAGAGTLAGMWQERAESLMAIQHYAEAAEDWRRLLRTMESERGGGATASVAKARLQLAISLRFTGQYVDAANEVEKVLQVEPENQMAR
jgi:hypothetical protein